METEVHVKLVVTLTTVNGWQITTEKTVKVNSLLHVSICIEPSIIQAPYIAFP